MPWSSLTSLHGLPYCPGLRSISPPRQEPAPKRFTQMCAEAFKNWLSQPATLAAVSCDPTFGLPAFAFEYWPPPNLANAGGDPKTAALSGKIDKMTGGQVQNPKKAASGITSLRR
jgi:hypothetical protein